MATNKNHNKFESVSEFIREIETAPTSKLFLEHRKEDKFLSSRREESDGESWFTTPNYNAAAELLANGDTNNAAKINNALRVKFSSCKTTAESIVKKHFLSVVGSSVNVPAYLSGSPKCMRRTQQKKVSSKVITVVYENAADCTNDGEDLATTNAAVVTAIMALERAGYRVNLYILQSYTNRGAETVSALIKIKSSGAYLNIINMAYPLINPSFYRRHGFRYIETREKLRSKCFTDHYGYCTTTREIKNILKERYSLKYDCLLVYDDIKTFTPSEILNYIVKNKK